LSWKVDRVLANQRLNLIADTQVTSDIPKAWFLELGSNRQEGKGFNQQHKIKSDTKSSLFIISCAVEA
jgi:hypothetical protein